MEKTTNNFEQLEQPEQPEQSEQLEQPETQEYITPYPTYKTFEVGNLSCTKAEQKTVPNTPQGSAPQTYYVIPLMYNTGTEEQPVLNDFLFEGCELYTKTGIIHKIQNGRQETSIMVQFDITNAENVRMIEAISNVHAGCAYILQQMKGSVKLYNFDSRMAEATGLKNPIYKPRDEMTGEIIQGRPPSFFMKCFRRGKAPLIEQTVFTGLDEQPIDWKLLEGVEMKFIPLIHIKRMYIGGGKASIQMEMVSAIVTYIKARGAGTAQGVTISKLISQRPELKDTVSAQIAKLNLERQDRFIEPSSSTNQDQQDDVNHPTFSNIAASGKIPNAAGFGIEGNSAPNMGSFTMSAPPRMSLPGSEAVTNFN